jgi:hypothetical protein
MDAVEIGVAMTFTWNLEHCAPSDAHGDDV